jgi:hypothetical protein
VGDDVNPCSRTAPCKTFAGAISKTAAGGEISVLDPGGFGAVTITKSISIVAEGVEGSILSTQTNGIIVNAGPNDIVSLRGILIEGATSGLSGIRFLAGRLLHIENCMIRGFRGASAGYGISMATSTQSRIFIKNSSIYHNSIGISVQAAGASLNSILVSRTSVDANLTANIVVDGSNSAVALSDSTISGGALSILNGGTLSSFGNNVIAPSGSPTITLPLK